MFKLLSLELILFLGFTIFAGLIYLLVTSYRSRGKDSSDDDDFDDSETMKSDETDEDRAWKAKRFWWFGR